MNPTQTDPYAAIMQKYNYAPPASSGQPVSDAQDFQSFVKSQNIQTPAKAPSEPGYLDRVGNDYAAAGESIKKNLASTPKPGDTSFGAQAKEIGAGFNTAGDVAGATFAPITEAPGIHQGIEGMGKAGSAISDQLMKIPGYSQFFEGLAKHLDSHPDEAHTIGSAINLGMLGLGGEGEEPVVDAAKTGANAAVDTATAAGKALGSAMDETTAAPADLLKGTQSFLSKDNVSPNLETSVGRLADSGHDPLDLYDQFHTQEQAAKGDVTQDTALGKVGGDIGKSFDKVIQMRKDAGQAMQDAMKDVGNTATDITEHFPDLEQELKDNGLTYDVDKGKLTGDRTSKVTSQDKALLQQYIGDLNKLGPKPTAAELDAFLSRIPNELDVFKNQNNITKVTNGERIIKSNLRALADSLKPTADDATFAPYAKAKADYAALSKFLDNGVQFLGKKTASGDYAKDTSLVKSSVKSILNNGKKDWLVKLEKLTGDPHLDKAVVALQAMKDAGDAQGESLLNLLAGEGMPTSPSGFIDKAASAAGKFVKQKVAGTPSEQTRRMIQGMLDSITKSKSAAPSSP